MNPNGTACSITIKKDIRVTVPASAKLMTTYILREQQGWFEDEVDFLETIIKPGMRVIDIGANYGLYTLIIAKLIGDTGKIWAFEPTEETAGYLGKSIVENRLSNIELIQAAVSNRVGTAQLYTSPNSEWNSLSEIAVAGAIREKVDLLTLDRCREKYAWKDIDFMKLDAEGEELHILAGGRRFLESESPLIMYELKQADKVSLPLINGFKASGYNSYRYIPGANVLVPFEPREPVDGFLLNLFACKEDRAAGLESSGLLVNNLGQGECTPDVHVIDKYLINFAFGRVVKDKIEFENSASSAYLEILSLYILAHTGSKTAYEKINYLQTALARVKTLVDRGEDRIERLCTFARIAFECGERTLGLKVLVIIISQHYDNLDFEITVPFLPAAPKFDELDPGNNLKAWLVASVLDQFVVMHAYSTYFSQRRSLPILNRLQQLGFMDEEMARRKKMIETIFPA